MEFMLKVLAIIFVSVVALGCSSSKVEYGLYSWEMQRDSIPQFSDISLLTGGYSVKKPDTWTEERAKAHVTYVDEAGAEHWLFEAFVFWANLDFKRGGLQFSIVPEGDSAVKESWLDWIDYWFNEQTGYVKVLDSVIGSAKERIGEPDFRHSVVATLPTPIMFKTFADKNSSTVYWGEIDGRQMDFSKLEDQIQAFKWMIDQIRTAWDRVAPKHLDLAGFYVMDEELYCTPESYNYQYKRWDMLLPPVADYAHSMNYGMYWIPYYMAPGYEHWKALGFDMVYMQPNHYWDWTAEKPFDKTIEIVKNLGMGMELEFEGTHGEGITPCSSILDRLTNGEKNPRAELNREMLRDYFRYFKEAGFYGRVPLAIYTGTNAMYELSISEEPADRQMYREFCEFVVNNKF
jgi:hypothetical protein